MAEEPVTIEPPSAIKLKKWRSPEMRAIACHSLEREPRAILDLCSVHRDGCVMALIAPSPTFGLIWFWAGLHTLIPSRSRVVDSALAMHHRLQVRPTRNEEA